MLPIDRRWLQKLGADVYMPILDGDNLTGVIAVGPRKSRDPYRARELELLQAIADQTAIALANARLVTDLKLSNDEIRGLNKTLAETNDQLKEMDRVKTDFITIASHELRTPLTQVLGYADLLQMMSAADTVPGAEIIPITDHVLKAGKRLNDIVSQMLDVSQMDASSIQLTLQETSLASVLRTAVEPFEEAFVERRLYYRAPDIHLLPPIQADGERMIKAIRNVMSNAIKFTPDGGSIDIRGKLVKTPNKPDTVEIIVTDSGIGIDKKHIDLIFEKFFRVGSTALHSTSNTKFMGAGPGLGLSITKGIIEAHKGSIWAESKGNDTKKLPGTEIHIILPVDPAAVDTSTKQAS
jgi:signal transduction histidine kinase